MLATSSKWPVEAYRKGREVESPGSSLSMVNDVSSEISGRQDLPRLATIPSDRF